MRIQEQVQAGGSQAGDEGLDPSLACFVNALVTETDAWQSTEDAFFAELPSGDRLRVPTVRRSRAGRHGLATPCTRVDADGNVTRLGFARAARLSLETLDADEEAGEAFLERVLRSRRNLDHAIDDRRGDLDRLFGEPLTFAEAEQGLLVGHSMHPCPKDRGRLSLADAERWAPEHEASFPLTWLAVDENRVTSWSEKGTAVEAIVDSLVEGTRADEHRHALAASERLVPCHPAQLEHWRSHPQLADAFDREAIRVLGEGSRIWQATSSVRTLYEASAPWMVKFSLSMKLTNSVRHLHPDELARGPQIADLARDGPIGRFQNRSERFEIVHEPASLALTDERGHPVDATGIVWRENRLPGDPAGTEMLATLLQDDPRDGTPRLARRLQATGREDEALEWFDRFLDVVLEPILLAQADHGIILGAHQQNLVLDLEGAWPEQAFFRDCQGIGFSPLARKRLPERMDRLEQEGALVFDEQQTTVLTTYYNIVNTTFNTISSLAALDTAREDALLDHLAEKLASLRAEGVREPIVLDHLLKADELHIKGNFHYALTGVNETTQDQDLLAFYRPIPNPIPRGRSR